MIMVEVAATLFGITTLLGFYLSSLALRNKETPKGVILIHGCISVVAFALLLIFCPYSLGSLLFFSTATVCGCRLLYQDITRKKFSKWLCVAHAVLTIIGFIFLVRIPS